MKDVWDLFTVIRLARMDAKLDLILKYQETIMQEIDDLKDAVEAIKTADQSIITLCQTISQQLKDMVSSATDLATLKAAVTDYATQLKGEAQAVADAVTANTPTPPTP